MIASYHRFRFRFRYRFRYRFPLPASRFRYRYRFPLPASRFRFRFRFPLPASASRFPLPASASAFRFRFRSRREGAYQNAHVKAANFHLFSSHTEDDKFAGWKRAPNHAFELLEMRRRWAGTAAAIVLLIAFWAIFWPRRSPSPTDRTQGPGAALNDPSGANGPLATPAPGGTSAATGARPPDDRIPMPGCWQGLRDFDKNASLTDMRAAITAAVEGGDPRLAGYLRERLTEMIGGDPERALSVLGWAKDASGPELSVIMGAIKDSAAVRDPGVAEKLLAIGEGKGEEKAASIELRSAALDALETQHRFDSGAIARIKAIALDDTSDSSAWMATRTLGRVMKEDFERTGSFEPYWKELLSVGKESEETPVQILALEMPSYADPILSGGDIDALAELLRKDPDRSVREMAAHRLSVTKEPDRVLAVYREAFPLERDECVRWAIFRFAVRVAGAGALPLLADFAAIDPRFAQDKQDFMTLYASGTVDFSRIWMGKVERHQCVVEEGLEGH